MYDPYPGGGPSALLAATLILLAAEASWLGVRQAPSSWCASVPRVEFDGLEHLGTEQDWFEVYRILPDVYAITEPYQFQEVISYLVVGSREAVLIDSGLGIGAMGPVVAGLTELPVTVVNTHTHFDHVGGNSEFASILALDDEFTRASSEGLPNEAVHAEVEPEALCRSLPEGLSVESYSVRPFTPTGVLRPGDRLDVGGRVLEVIPIPGHTPDSIALLDADNALLWTGDSFYEGAIFLFAPETDLDEYRHSIDQLAALAPSLRYVLPAHNTTLVDPVRLTAFREALARLLAGEGNAVGTRRQGLFRYDIGGFTFLVREGLLPSVDVGADERTSERAPTRYPNRPPPTG